MKTSIATRILLASSIGIASVGCSGDPEPGTLNVVVYGEEFIEQGIPAPTFNDGWAVTFDRFLLHVQSVSAAQKGQPATLNASTGWVFDVAADTNGAGHPVTTGMVVGGTYDEVNYHVSPALATSMAGNASAADRAALVAAGASVAAIGKATKGAVTKTFAWYFKTNTHYKACEGTARVDGGAATLQLTIHGDHLFYDDLVAEEPFVSFDLIAAADKDADNIITQGELEAADITAQARYQVGSTAVDDLWGFISFQTSTLGHIDGEGHCAVTDRL